MELKYITTTYKENVRNTEEETFVFLPDPDTENEIINLYPQMKYQTMEGFGGAVTDSAGYIFSLMSKEQQEQVVNHYFGTDGLHYNTVRIPIDSCDFSLEQYESDGEETDADLEHFNMERADRYIIPLLEAAERAYGGKLNIMLSPWSPPAYMKTNGIRAHGGKLKAEYRERWAEYICRYIEEFRKRGYRITRISMQNEPKAVQTWDSCIYTAQEQKNFLQNYMWKAMEKHGLTDIEIYLWDHNKERVFDWAETIIDQETDAMVAGMAFHWYSGDHFEALQMVKARFPEKKLLLSEACIEYSKFSADDYLGNAQKYGHDMIGNLNAGMNTFIDWNLVLDEEGGPNHVGNFCDAPYLFDTNHKELIESNILGYIWHFAHFIEPGAVRIGVSRYTDKVEACAFQKDSKITVVLLNRTDQEIPVCLRLADQTVAIKVKPMAIATGVITQDKSM